MTGTLESKRLARFVVQKDWEFRVKMTEQKLRKEVSLIFFEDFIKRRLKKSKRQEKVDVVREGIWKDGDSEGK